MIVFKFRKRKSIKERKIVLISQSNQINEEIYNMRPLYHRDYSYESIQIGGQIN